MQHMFSGKSEKPKINKPKGIALKLQKPLPKLKVPKLPKVPKLKVKEPKVKAPDGPPVGSPDGPPVWSPDGPPFGLSDHCLCRFEYRFVDLPLKYIIL
ncbi:hypothetical protein F2Q69_00037931 [Brassica cretica]|uniref:Uncharacterized protein n=1 Tax=Brassica cretica TaxID=69181 RepID=A0A8S9SKQ8_BRACR|nr:hypothetical protein F2Q69_00037931 [Brassica cretica]